MLTRQLLIWTALTAAVIAAVSAAIIAAFRETSFALGILCGCGLGLASLAGLDRHVRRATTGRRGIVMLSFGKYAIIGVAIWILLRVGANGAGLAVGLSIVYASLTVSGIRQARRLRDIEET